jgi:ABC-type Zn2+ transport system substrate-binding protein/surface adhesin
MSETHVPDEHGSSKAVEGTHGSTSDHGDDHGHDDHGHPAEALGPVDWAMWGAGVLGVVVGLIVTAGLVLATSFSFSA